MFFSSRGIVRSRAHRFFFNGGYNLMCRAVGSTRDGRTQLAARVCGGWVNGNS